MTIRSVACQERHSIASVACRQRSSNCGCTEHKRSHLTSSVPNQRQPIQKVKNMKSEGRAAQPPRGVDPINNLVLVCRTGWESRDRFWVRRKKMEEPLMKLTSGINCQSSCRSMACAWIQTRACGDLLMRLWRRNSDRVMSFFSWVGVVLRVIRKTYYSM